MGREGGLSGSKLEIEEGRCPQNSSPAWVWVSSQGAKSVCSEGWPGQGIQSLNRVWRTTEGEGYIRTGKRLSGSSYTKGDLLSKTRFSLLEKGVPGPGKGNQKKPRGVRDWNCMYQ